MDPDATLKRIDEALTDGDHEEADAAVADLAYWIAHGGFCPVWSRASREARAYYMAQSARLLAMR